MIKLTLAAAILLASTPALAQEAPHAALNTQATALIQGCQALAGTSKKSGFYWVTFDPANQALMYCDNEIEFQGLKGGWTLVWSNMRGGRGKPATDLAWGASIETLPRYDGAPIYTVSPDRQSFQVFTGLKWWLQIRNAGSRHEMIYEWSHDFSPDRHIDRRAGCRFNLNPDDLWLLTIEQPSCFDLIGGELPAMVTTANGQRWSTIDRDNDHHSGVNCASTYGAPWWYYACWQGSISGGGEDQYAGIFNGAYWRDSDRKWGQVDGTGAGNGWIYIR